MISRQNLQVFSDTIEKANGDLEYSALNLYPDKIKGVDIPAALQKWASEPKKVAQTKKVEVTAVTVAAKGENKAEASKAAVMDAPA